MGLSLSTLTAYVEQNKLPLITKTLLGSQTAKRMNMQAGIKSSATINIVDTNATFQASGCTWNASGTTSVTQRTITVGNINVMESICIKDLEAYFTQTSVRAGTALGQSLPFEQQYAELKADYIASQLEIAYWQGDTSSSNPNLKRFDGWIKLIDAAGTAVNGNPTGITTGTGITSSNVVGIVNGIYAKIPAQILRKGTSAVFMGTDTWRTYQQALITANLYNYSGAAAPVNGELEITIPGTNIKCVALDGLTGTNRIFAGDAMNFYIGTDLLGEEEKFEMWYSRDNLDFRFLADFKAGTNVAFPNEIVSFKLV